MWARLDNGIVAEIITESPIGRFHSDLDFVPCDLSTTVGDEFTGNGFKKPAPESEQPEKKAKRYLDDTNWYLFRELETGQPMPANIKQARAEAYAKLPEQA